MNSRAFSFALVVVISLGAGSVFAQPPAPARELGLSLDPAQTEAGITLSASLHIVEGKFLLKRGVVHYDPATGSVSGEIAIDATSGKTGNGSRDHKMHMDVLESQRYPEIVFRPDRAEGVLSPTGASTLRIHGQFAIHGAEHEVTIPVEVTLSENHWNVKAAFAVPYEKWGMKNPSVLFLRVADTVEVQFHAAGSSNP